jgi:hypothetical protein
MGGAEGKFLTSEKVPPFCCKSHYTSGMTRSGPDLHKVPPPVSGPLVNGRPLMRERCRPYMRALDAAQSTGRWTGLTDPSRIHHRPIRKHVPRVNACVTFLFRSTGWAWKEHLHAARRFTSGAVCRIDGHFLRHGPVLRIR